MYLQNAERYSHFKEDVEKPILKASVASIIAGTIFGAVATYFWLVNAIPVGSLAGAVLAGAAVGANIGLLLFGLADVVFSGRLEYGANIIEDADAEIVEPDEDGEQILETLGREDYAFTLPKAS